MAIDFTQITTSTESILLVNPTTSKEIGLYVFNFEVCLENYPAVCAVFESKFEISCEPRFLTMNSFDLTKDKTYTLGNPVLSWSLDTTSLTTQIPACGYEEIYSVSFAPQFNSHSSFIWTISPSSINF